MSENRVTLLFSDSQTRTVLVPQSETVVRAAARAKLKLLTDCREGGCGTCKARCRVGEFVLEDFSTEALTAEEEASGNVLTCRMKPLTDCLIEFDYPMSVALRGKPPKPRPVTITGIEHLAEDVIELRVTADDGKPFDFLSGQYANVIIPTSNVSRSYSFVSAPGSENATFVVRLVPSGAMSGWLSQRAEIGEKLLIDGPFGRFFLRENGHPIVMVAGGTGVGPMLSILDTLVESNRTAVPIHLAFGITSSRNAFYQDCIAQSLERFERADSTIAAMQVEPGWCGLQGTVIDALEAAQLPSEFDAYLCGPPAMIDAARTWLLQLGVSDTNIFSETFVKTKTNETALSVSQNHN